MSELRKDCEIGACIHAGWQLPCPAGVHATLPFTPGWPRPTPVCRLAKNSLANALRTKSNPTPCCPHCRLAKNSLANALTTVCGTPQYVAPEIIKVPALACCQSQCAMHCLCQQGAPACCYLVEDGSRSLLRRAAATSSTGPPATSGPWA